LPVAKYTAQLSSPPIPGTENFSERNGSTGQLGAYSPAQEPIPVEDADLGHVPRVKPQCHRFSNVGCQRCREIAETWK
jgi:hypothetical protein